MSLLYDKSLENLKIPLLWRGAPLGRGGKLFSTKFFKHNLFFINPLIFTDYSFEEKL
jgi:hypothetical protein